jgi:hypothetical protein
MQLCKCGCGGEIVIQLHHLDNGIKMSVPQRALRRDKDGQG